VEMTSRDAREDRLKWLLRPFDWALGVCIYPVLLTGMMWFDGKLPLQDAAVILFGALVIAAGLILWGIRRVMNAARGRW
jgi:hypothetical protein